MLPPPPPASFQGAILASAQRQNGGQAVPDLYKQFLKGMAGALASELGATSLAALAGQGSSNQYITTKNPAPGTCQSASGDVPLLIPNLTSQLYDSYGLPILGGPADPLGGNLRIMDTAAPGSPSQMLAIGRVKSGVGPLAFLSGMDVGPGLSLTPYGKRIATDAAGTGHLAPGAVDKVVNKPLLQLSLGQGMTISGTPAGGAQGQGETAADPAWGDVPIVKPDGSMLTRAGATYSGPFGYPGLDPASVQAAHQWLIGTSRTASTGGFVTPNIGQADFPNAVTTTATGPSGLAFGGKDGNVMMLNADGTSITIDKDTGVVSAVGGGASGASAGYTPGHAIEFNTAKSSDAPSAALTAAVTAGSGLGIGTYQVWYSYLDSNGAETLLSPAASFATTSGNQQATYTIPASPSGQTITGINLYRSKANGKTSYTLTSVTVTGTSYAGGTYTDSTADSALGSAYTQRQVIQGYLAWQDSAKTIPANGLTRIAGFDKKGLAINLAGGTLGGGTTNLSGLSISLPDPTGKNNGLGIVPHTTIGGTPDNGLVIDTFGVGIRQATTATSLIVDSRDTLKVQNDNKTIHSNSKNQEEAISVLSPNGSTDPRGTRSNPFGCGAQTWQSTGDGVAAVATPTPPSTGGGLQGSPTTPPSSSYPTSTTASPPGPGYNCAGNAPATEYFSSLTFNQTDTAAYSQVISSGFVLRTQTSDPASGTLNIPTGPGGANGSGFWLQYQVKVLQNVVDPNTGFTGIAAQDLNFGTGASGQLVWLPVDQKWHVLDGFLPGGGMIPSVQPGTTCYVAWYGDCQGYLHLLMGTSASAFTEVYKNNFNPATGVNLEFGASGCFSSGFPRTSSSKVVSEFAISAIYVSDGVPPGTSIAAFNGTANTFNGTPGSMDANGNPIP